MSNIRIIRAHNNVEFGAYAKLAFMDAMRGVSPLPRAELPHVILPTGSTPAPFYEALRADAENIRPFHYLQLDEYVGLPPEDFILFSNWLARDVLDPLKIENRMLFNSAADPDQEVARIRAWHQARARIDVAVLGIGEDGHIGFNLPGCNLDGLTHRDTLTEQAWEANNKYWNREVPKQIITLGLAELKMARHTILLARGDAKADILYKAFFEKMTENVPASYLQRQRNVTLIGDEAALSRFPR